MRLRFTKMHGAGNDFVVLDATQAALALTREQLRRLGDRRFGVGADQILVVESPTADERESGIDFRYRIFNGASGAEVEHCGNGARCFVRFVHQRGLSAKPVLRVATVNNRLELRTQADGRVTVDMNRPIFEPEHVPFDPGGLQPRRVGGMALWPLADEVLFVGHPQLQYCFNDSGSGRKRCRRLIRESKVQKFLCYNAGPHPNFVMSSAFSLMIEANTQDEINALYDGLSEGGEQQPCGWLVDKFGLSWQITPKYLMQNLTS